MNIFRRGGFQCAMVAWFAATPAHAQRRAPPPDEPVESRSLPARIGSQARRGFLTLVEDHALLWSSPARSPGQALKTVMPFVAATAVALTMDHRVESGLPNSADQVRYSKAVSVGGAYYSLAAGAGALAAVGAAAGSRRAVETGMLAAVAVAHTESIAQMLKYATGRERPDFGDSARGRFWRREQSFPSGHAMGTWAVATVISKEYHQNRFIRYGIYALPLAISASRVGAQRHFLSDVVAGGSIGYLLGAWLYDRHHNPDLGGAAIRRQRISIAPDFRFNGRYGGFTAGVNISR
jgi:membrane-associated phospholipid phosphatase